ncbi:WXG100 family type VII secretion target [Kineosporia sp. J2-2]|uniref:ESAT-6-like protein n=1 Tax=Kineosporia corallincola TaxID=2835133 RepID=A0ABS5TQY7_9ACTN|nr:WXG100 family type VII secretion target [Kineosporia corallincola]MBT0772843.1 WXG100 family type VII secretion target [Kineosporia corallincola]
MPELTYSVNFSSMDLTVDAAKQRAQNIENLLQEMNSNAQKSLAGWTGDAQAAYAETFQRCLQAAAAMPQTLEQARVTLSSISENYQSTETFVTTAFRPK